MSAESEDVYLFDWTAIECLSSRHQPFVQSAEFDTAKQQGYFAVCSNSVDYIVRFGKDTPVADLARSLRQASRFGNPAYHTVRRVVAQWQSTLDPQANEDPAYYVAAQALEARQAGYLPHVITEDLEIGLVLPSMRDLCNSFEITTWNCDAFLKNRRR